jgi:valyl-tRNA synthetase
MDEPSASFSATARLAVGSVIVEIDTAGTIDLIAERKRLEKDLALARKESAQAAAKLGNDQFMAKAPEDVVGKVRARAAQAEADIVRLEAQLVALAGA